MQPNRLTALWVKHCYAIALQVDHPVVDSMVEISRFLSSRRIQVESVHARDEGKLGVIMPLLFHLEKDRLKHTLDLLSALKCVLKLEEVSSS